MFLRDPSSVPRRPHQKHNRSSPFLPTRHKSTSRPSTPDADYPPTIAHPFSTSLLCPVPIQWVRPQDQLADALMHPTRNPFRFRVFGLTTPGIVAVFNGPVVHDTSIVTNCGAYARSKESAPSEWVDLSSMLTKLSSPPALEASFTTHPRGVMHSSELMNDNLHAHMPNVVVDHDRGNLCATSTHVTHLPPHPGTNCIPPVATPGFSTPFLTRMNIQGTYSQKITGVHPTIAGWALPHPSSNIPPSFGSLVTQFVHAPSPGDMHGVMAHIEHSYPPPVIRVKYRAIERRADPPHSSSVGLPSLPIPTRASNGGENLQPPSTSMPASDLVPLSLRAEATADTSSVIPSVQGIKIKCGVRAYKDGPICAHESTITGMQLQDLRAHLEGPAHPTVYHVDASSTNVDKENRSRICPDVRCICLAPTCEKRKRGEPHRAHVKDLLEHWKTQHLHFKWYCDLCKDVEWSSMFALQRHRKKCQKMTTEMERHAAGRRRRQTRERRGPEVSRCTGCAMLFPSESDHCQHIITGSCPASSAHTSLNLI